MYNQEELLESYGFDFKADDGGTPPEEGESNTATITVEVQPPGPTIIFEEDFESGLPVDWTIIDGGESDDTWELADADDWTDRNHWSGIITSQFMVVDSDSAPGDDMDEQLITPSIDCSAYQNVTLKLTHQFVYYQTQTGDIDIRINGGSWQNLMRYQYTNVSENLELDISSYADGQSDVQMRWHFYNANWDWYWGIDDVELSGSGSGSSSGSGNLDGDCDVDMADFAVLAAAWLSGSGDANWNPDCDISDPPDDFIDELDLSVLTGNWLLGAQ